jgi:hypothetical protein
MTHIKITDLCGIQFEDISDLEQESINGGFPWPVVAAIAAVAIPSIIGSIEHKRFFVGYDSEIRDKAPKKGNLWDGIKSVFGF